MGSAAEWSQLPVDGLPEIAFVGRSNAGKSTAINCLTGRRSLAYTSKRPGRTQTLNFFRLGERGLLVDLPGYGYSRADAATQQRWQDLISRYLTQRVALAGLVLLVDSRRGLGELDRLLLEWTATRAAPVLILLTKCDKLPRSQRAGVVAAALRKLGGFDLGEKSPTAVRLFSAPEKIGVADAVATLLDWLGEKREPLGQGE